MDTAEGAETFTLQKEFLTAINTGQRYIKPTEVNPACTVLHVKPTQNGNSAVYAYNGIVCFRKLFTYSLPAMLLTAECCKTLSEFETVNYSSSGNFDFFHTGKTLYGFIKCEYKTPDFEVLFNRYERTELFEVNKTELEQFCELTNTCTVSPNPIAKLRNNADGVELEYDDSDMDVHINRVLEATKATDVAEFHFNAKVMHPSLKNFPFNDLQFNTSLKSVMQLYSKEDESVMLIVMGVAQVN